MGWIQDDKETIGNPMSITFSDFQEDYIDSKGFFEWIKASIQNDVMEPMELTYVGGFYKLEIDECPISG